MRKQWRVVWLDKNAQRHLRVFSQERWATALLTKLSHSESGATNVSWQLEIIKALELPINLFPSEG